MLQVNERAFDFRPGLRLDELAKGLKPEADVYIVNGFPVPAATELHDGDNCWLIKRGEQISFPEMEHLLYARHTPGVQLKVKDSIIGIMGLGGLGSVVASALARIGVGTLLLADYDVVEPSNLNRQQYFVDQVGLKKTDAMRQNLMRVNPYLKVETFDCELTESNIPLIFKHVNVLVECFDGPRMKASALRVALTLLPTIGYVGASGLAGFDDNNLISTRKIRQNIYVVGDGAAEAKPGQGLMAPRVGIAAHHQANQVLRILLGLG
jgi:sulfur carrier protein ThiS adenylyltransferase